MPNSEKQPDTDEDQLAEHVVEVHTSHGDFSQETIQATSKKQAMMEAASYEAWEIGIEPGALGEEFDHVTVFAPSRKTAEMAARGEGPDECSVIENSQFKLGDVTRVEYQGEA